MTINDIVALASVVIAIATNIGLYIHLSSTMNSRFDSMNAAVNARFDSMDRKVSTGFDSVERRLELVQGSLHEMDIRLTKLER